MTISALNAALATNSTAGADRTTISSNFNTFLTLLTTQLKNQDPLAPTDTNTFTQQLVQYSQVEQQMKTNDKLDNISKLQGNLKINSALGMIGGDVKFVGDKFTANGGTTEIDYYLPQDATEMNILIQDENGNTVYKTAAETAKGDHVFHWDGKLSDGTMAPEGNYKVVVTGKDTSGSGLKGYTTLWSQVMKVHATDKDLVLELQDGSLISYDDVSDIRSHASKPTI